MKKKPKVKHLKSSIKKAPKSKALKSISEIQALRKKVAELNEWRRRLSGLLTYTKKASTKTTVDELLVLMVEEAKTVLRAERATVFLVDKEKNELWSKVASGTKTIRVPLNKGIAGAVAIAGTILNIKDVYKDDRFNPEVDKKTGFKTKTVLAAPMMSQKGEVIGVFQVLNRRQGGSFDIQDEQILTLLSEQASANVENATLYQEIRKTAQETIIRLAGAVEYKDSDTRDHLWRMAQYSAIIAREMGCDPDWVENIRLAAPMHDVGKIGVPDAVLNKPGKLNPEEWVEMKKHPEYGYNILKGSKSELMEMSATVAYCHHERWDGNGYPRGLKGTEIPIEARIASLADVFDALTSKRIYKPSFSVEESLQLIREERGTQFDPEIVDIFFNCLPQILPIMENYAPKDGIQKIPTPTSF